MHKPSSDLERVYRALEEQWDDQERHVRHSRIMHDPAEDAAQGRMEGHRRRLYAHCRAAATVSIAIWPGFHDKALRARRRCRLDHHRRASAPIWRPARSSASSGLMNPQIRFGEDLMSRVSYVMMNPGGDKEMTAAVREALNTLAGAGRAPKRASS